MEIYAKNISHLFAKYIYGNTGAVQPITSQTLKLQKLYERGREHAVLLFLKQFF